jgi:tocopherol O-methyltransferase
MYPDVHTYYDETRFDYRTIWNNRANLAVHFGYYDDRARTHHAALDNLNRVLAERAGIRPGEAVLDAGCGMGGSCFWLAENFDGLRVTGISIVASQIDDCRRAAVRRGQPGVRFEQADYSATPFDAASFDVVWACESLCHAADKARFYREAFRLLRPGGRLVLAEYVRRQRPAPEPGETLLRSWLHPWAIPDLDTLEEHRRHAQAAGFAAVDWDDVTPHMRVSLRNLHELCRQWWPWGRILHALRIVSAVRLANVRASIRQYEALEADAWYYAIAVCRK